MFRVVGTFAFVMSGGVAVTVVILIGRTVAVEMSGVGRTGGAYFCCRVFL